jgi:hypothetical protein
MRSIRRISVSCYLLFLFLFSLYFKILNQMLDYRLRYYRVNTMIAQYLFYQVSFFFFFSLYEHIYVYILMLVYKYFVYTFYSLWSSKVTTTICSTIITGSTWFWWWTLEIITPAITCPIRTYRTW